MLVAQPGPKRWTILAYLECVIVVVVFIVVAISSMAVGGGKCTVSTRAEP